MKKFLISSLLVAMLSACADGDSLPALGVASNTTLATTAAAAGALAGTTFNFPSGVTELGTTGATTFAFTGSGAEPSFRISDSTGGTASGVTTFGSCIFRVTSSTFRAPSLLVEGATIRVAICNINAATSGLPATGVAANRAVSLLLGAAKSADVSVTVGVTAGGQLTINGQTAGTVTLTPITGS